MGFTITAEYVDTCFPDYLQDSYTRNGELLLSISRGHEDIDTAVHGLMCQFHGEYVEGFPDDVSNEDVERVMRDAIRGIDLRAVDDDGNEVDDPDEGAEEQPNIYVVLRWSREDE